MRIRIRRGTLFVAALCLFTFTICLFVGIFAFRRGSGKIDLPQKYWFLVRTCEETTAGAVAGESYVAGGAGYLMDGNVVLACYYTAGDAERVQSNMRVKGVETEIVEREAKAFDPGYSRAAERERISSNARTVDSAARLLYDMANGLERGISQEEGRAAVNGVVKSLQGLAADNQSSYYALWNAALSVYAHRGTEIASGILYAKDLRYLQVGLCDLILNMGEYF